MIKPAGHTYTNEFHRNGIKHPFHIKTTIICAGGTFNKLMIYLSFYLYDSKT